MTFSAHKKNYRDADQQRGNRYKRKLVPNCHWGSP